MSAGELWITPANAVPCGVTTKHTEWLLPFSAMPIMNPGDWYIVARIEGGRPKGRVALEMWKMPHGWEFIRHFDNVEEAKAFGITLARLEY